MFVWLQQPVLNFSSDLKDSSVFSLLLHRLSNSVNHRPPFFCLPRSTDRSKTSHRKVSERAARGFAA